MQYMQPGIRNHIGIEDSELSFKALGNHLRSSHREVMPSESYVWFGDRDKGQE